jgi:hypothetical protein
VGCRRAARLNPWSRRIRIVGALASCRPDSPYEANRHEVRRAFTRPASPLEVFGVLYQGMALAVPTRSPGNPAFRPCQRTPGQSAFRPQISEAGEAGCAQRARARRAFGVLYQGTALSVPTRTPGQSAFCPQISQTGEAGCAQRARPQAGAGKAKHTSPMPGGVPVIAIVEGPPGRTP